MDSNKDFFLDSYSLERVVAQLPTTMGLRVSTLR